MGYYNEPVMPYSRPGAVSPREGSSAAGMTVTELNRIIAGAIRSDPRTRSVTVTAEVSGFKNHFPSGHWYFILKDETSAISCVMFRQNNMRGAVIRPKDGDSVTVTGHVEIYERDGKVQLYVDTMRPAGQGGLYERLEALKRKLAAEGLFDPGRKRTLPMRPRKVAVVTSASGAALHDILNVSGGRSPGIPIVIVPSAVQGAQAAGEIAAAMRTAGSLPGVDVVILARGGGSMEDLWCFNEEEVVRAVAACPVPVVSGVGHEVDTPLCDFAADVRASTPSNAAEIVFPDREELRHRTEVQKIRLCRAMEGRMNREVLKVRSVQQRLQKSSPERRVRLLAERNGIVSERLKSAVEKRLEQAAGEIRVRKMRLDHAMTRMMDSRSSRLRNIRTRLEALSPLSVLDRGYTLVYDGKGHVVGKAAEAAAETMLKIRFADGEVKVRPEKENG